MYNRSDVAELLAAGIWREITEEEALALLDKPKQEEPEAMHDLLSKLEEANGYIAHLEHRIAAKDQVFAEILMTVGGNCFDPTPIEEPAIDGPWLPCGLISKIDSVMKKEHRA